MEEEKKEVPGSALEEKQAGAYSSQWQGQLEDTIAKILDRKDFSYDLNGDALYQQYKDRYIQGGQMGLWRRMVFAGIPLQTAILQ